MIRVALLGKTGRMGQRVLDLIAHDYQSQICEASLEEADAILDFSAPAAVLQAVQKIHTHPHQPVWVIGSTGWTPSELAALGRLSQKTLILRSANFSLGVWILNSMLKRYAPTLSRLGFVPKLTETHHIHKKDAPSGTALLLQQTLKSAGCDPAIESIRSGEVIGDHRLDFLGMHEKLTLEHSALERTVFARGAIEATLWLVKQRKAQPERHGEVSMSEFVEHVVTID